jgi:hypothetical protein
MKAKILFYALPALILATFHLAEAQQATKIPRIGYLGFGFLSSRGSANPLRADAFRQDCASLAT